MKNVSFFIIEQIKKYRKCPALYNIRILVSYVQASYLAEIRGMYQMCTRFKFCLKYN